MNKTKKVKIDSRVDVQELPFVPPDTHFLSEHFIVQLPVSDPHFEDPWKLRVHVAKIIERRLGDHVQLTSMKVKKPHLVAKSVARLRRREPCARAFVTIEF
jgi:hypothetical protein